MISWIRAGKETPLTDRNKYWLLSHDGLGMPTFHRLEERGPLQHGVTDRGYRLDARTIILVVGIRGKTPEEFYQHRREVLELFNPGLDSGSLRWKRGDIIRQVDGHLISGLQFSDREREYLFQRAAIALKCPDPTWYDPQGRFVNFNIGGGGDLLEVPLSVPMTVGASAIDSSQSIIYGGSVRTFPRIEIRGPITNCRIENFSTNEKIEFPDHTIPAGVKYTVDLRYGHKTVFDDSEVNRISTISEDSDIATFSLDPAPQVTGGSNSIYVSGADVTAQTQITVQFYERFIGV